MLRALCASLFLILVLSTLCSAHLVLPTRAASSEIIEVKDAGFGFGWSANAGDTWRVNNATLILNEEALVSPPSNPISGDAGSHQANPYKINLNNVGFGFGWGVNVSEVYGASNSMTYGGAQTFNSKAPIQPTSATISGDAGPEQQNQALIYLNNIGFSFGWSSNASDRYNPSSTTAAGSPTSLNNNGLSPPAAEAIPDNPFWIVFPLVMLITLVFFGNLWKKKSN